MQGCAFQLLGLEASRLLGFRGSGSRELQEAANPELSNTYVDIDFVCICTSNCFLLSFMLRI